MDEAIPIHEQVHENKISPMQAHDAKEESKKQKPPLDNASYSDASIVKEKIDVEDTKHMVIISDIKDPATELPPHQEEKDVFEMDDESLI